MKEFCLGDQTITYDREATLTAYEIVESGCSERCECNQCRNFAKQKDSVYPPEFLALLDQLGIDPTKEADVHESGVLEDGICPYGGWFYLVGSMLKPGESVAGVAQGWRCFFRSAGGNFAGSRAWSGKPVLALEFMAKIPWLLPEDKFP